LKIEKQRLSQRLLCFPPDAVFPSGSMSESNMFRVGNAPRSSDASQSITELSLDDLGSPDDVFPSGSMSKSDMFLKGNAPRSSEASQSITELSLDDLLGPTEESL